MASFVSFYMVAHGSPHRYENTQSDDRRARARSVRAAASESARAVRLARVPPGRRRPTTDRTAAEALGPGVGCEMLEAAMTTAREIMTADATCVGAEESVLEAARKMTELGVGALPICGTDNKLKGMLTDRDIVVKVLGQGRDPAEVKAGELAQGEAVTIGADDDTAEILRTMTEHKVRRLPVIDGHTLVGIVAQADVARSLPDPQVGDLVQALSTD